MFVVKGATSATCTFTAYNDPGTTALAVHMPPGNGATTASKHTIFNLAVAGSDVYVTGAAQTFTMPAGCSSLQITVIGGGGGGGGTKVGCGDYLRERGRRWGHWVCGW